MSFTGPVRQIIAGHDDDGTAVIVADGPASRIFDALGEEGLVFQEIWHTAETPALIDRDRREADEAGLVLAPPKNGVRIRVLDIPPEAEGADMGTSSSPATPPTSCPLPGPRASTRPSPMSTTCRKR